jgi:nucleotide-binding universal stress UspA family protein
MFKTIVIGYDGTDRSEDALALGCRLAAASNAHVVIAFAYAGRSLPVQFGSAAIGIRMGEEADAVLHQASKRVPPGVRASLRKLPEPSPAHALHDLVEKESADLLVLGSTSHGPLGRVFAGTMATRLLHGLPCAVAVAPIGFAERETEPSGTIAACYDGSTESELALGAAVGLCDAMDARLRVLTVIDRQSHPTDRGVYVPDLDRMTGLGEDLLSAALSHVPDTVEATGKALLGSPATELARDATVEELDLLVTGSRGYGPVGRVLLGSVAARLMRLAPCPVLVVPRSAAVVDEGSEQSLVTSV